MQTISNSIQVNQALLMVKLKNANCIIDATCGNGNDTLFLARNSLNSKIYAFDIQEEAILNTINKTYDYKNRIKYIKDNHLFLEKYVQEKIDIAVFNLGYLPGKNHNITTKTDITIKTLKLYLQNLNSNGVISILIYPGHEEGQKEYQAIKQLVSNLDEGEPHTRDFSHE